MFWRAEAPPVSFFVLLADPRALHRFIVICRTRIKPPSVLSRRDPVWTGRLSFALSLCGEWINPSSVIVCTLINTAGRWVFQRRVPPRVAV